MINTSSINDILDLTQTSAAILFEQFEYPWEILGYIKDFIFEAGKALPKDLYDCPKEGVWISKSATVASSASIEAPCIIEEGSEIRHCAYIRGSVLVGKNCVIGNSCEIKNSIIFNHVQVPHFNYVGDSVLGYRSHLGAGVILSNIKSDRTNVTVKKDGEKLETGKRKFGAVIGDFSEIGCNAVLFPGSVIGRSCMVYPLAAVRGWVPDGHIYKSATDIVRIVN